ncbi:MAG: type II secretion system protein [Planctomycetota bacterium]
MSSEIRSSRRRLRGFTLVELLVVIGIIALLVGILLPTLSRAQSSARSVASAANQRQIATAFVGYMTDNQQTAPHGLAYQSSILWGVTVPKPVGPEQGYAAGTTSRPFVTWVTLLSDYMGASDLGPELWPLPAVLDNERRNKVGESFLCPSVELGSQGGVVSYAANPTVMPDIRSETFGLDGSDGAGGAVNFIPFKAPTGAVKVQGIPYPAKAGQLFADNALFWDTPTYFNLPDWATRAWLTSYAISFIDMDGFGDFPSYGSGPFGQRSRYRDAVDAPPGSPDYESYNDELSVHYPRPGFFIGDDNYDLSNSQAVAINPTNNSFSFYILPAGNLRFRQLGDTRANVAFADGSVQSLAWSPKVAHPAGEDYAETEFKRSFYRIKLPANIDLDRGI